MKKLLVGGAVCAAVLSMSSVAYAGEVTGNGKTLDMHGRSACSFSGLEDWAAPPPQDGIKVSPGTVQNWGHVKQMFGLSGGANSVVTPFGEEGCNAHLYPTR